MIRKTETKIHVKCPYNTLFVEDCHRFNGKWNAATGEWILDIRDEPAVREKLLLYFGTDGETKLPLCTVRMILLPAFDGPQIRLGGRVLVRRGSRDSKVKLGDGVVVLEGGFPSCGGSMKNPRVDPKEGTILEVRDFPLALAKQIVAKGINNCEINIIDEPQLTEREVAIISIKHLMAVHNILPEELS